MSRGDSKEKAIMGAAAPKPPLAIHPHSKLWGFLAFSREEPCCPQILLAIHPGLHLLRKQA